jgi:ribosome-associated translation inhibitor RaiA
VSTVNQFKLAANAGEPDSVLALRIDVLKAATDWYDTLASGDFERIDAAETKLERAVRKYKAAVKHRVPAVHRYLDAT